MIGLNNCQYKCITVILYHCMSDPIDWDRLNCNCYLLCLIISSYILLFKLICIILNDMQRYICCTRVEWVESNRHRCFCLYISQICFLNWCQPRRQIFLITYFWAPNSKFEMPIIDSTTKLTLVLNSYKYPLGYLIKLSLAGRDATSETFSTFQVQHSLNFKKLFT